MEAGLAQRIIKTDLEWLASYIDGILIQMCLRLPSMTLLVLVADNWKK